MEIHFYNPLYDSITLDGRTLNSLLLNIWNVSDLQKRSLWIE